MISGFPYRPPFLTQCKIKNMKVPGHKPGLPDEVIILLLSAFIFAFEAGHSADLSVKLRILIVLVLTGIYSASSALPLCVCLSGTRPGSGPAPASERQGRGASGFSCKISISSSPKPSDIVGGRPSQTFARRSPPSWHSEEVVSNPPAEKKSQWPLQSASVILLRRNG